MEPITAEAVANTLERASDEIMIRGWTQGTIENEAGEVCSVGGIAYATGEDRHWDGLLMYPQSPLGRAAEKALKAAGYIAGIDPFMDVENWNDDEGRTEDDVHEAFRMTAKKVLNHEIEVS